MDNPIEKDEIPDRVFTSDEFRTLNSKSINLRKLIDKERQHDQWLTAEIKSKSTTKAVVDPSDKTKKIQTTVPLSPAQIATRRAHRDQVRSRLATSTTELRSVEKDLRAASKQMSATARQDAVITRAQSKANLNPSKFAEASLRKLFESDNAQIKSAMAHFKDEWAKNPAAIREEILEMLRTHFPSLHQIIASNPVVEQLMFTFLLGGKSEEQK